MNKELWWMKTRLPPSLSVRGEEEFNPTLSGRSRQSPGAPSLKHLLWKQKICGKKSAAVRFPLIAAALCLNPANRRKHTWSARYLFHWRETRTGKLQANFFQCHTGWEDSGLLYVCVGALCPVQHVKGALIPRNTLVKFVCVKQKLWTACAIFLLYWKFLLDVARLKHAALPFKNQDYRGTTVNACKLNCSSPSYLFFLNLFCMTNKMTFFLPSRPVWKSN